MQIKIKFDCLCDKPSHCYEVVATDNLQVAKLLAASGEDFVEQSFDNRGCRMATIILRRIK